MNDNEFDQLITECIERDKLLKTVNRNIMNYIKKSRRHTFWGRIMKMAAIAFGCPLLFSIYCWITYSRMAVVNHSPVALGFIGLTVIILFASLTVFISKIQAEDL